MVPVAKTMRLVYITDGDTIPRILTEALSGEGIEELVPWPGLGALRGSSYDAVVISQLPDECSTEDLLEQIQRACPGLPVIVHDAAGTPAQAVRLIKMGAFHFVAGYDPEELRRALEWAIECREAGPIPSASRPPASAGANYSSAQASPCGGWWR